MKAAREAAARRLRTQACSCDRRHIAAVDCDRCGPGIIRQQQKAAMERLLYVLDEPWVTKLLEGELDRILDEETGE